jgi:hypothetical protein
MDDALLKEYLRLRTQKSSGNNGYYQITLLANDDGFLEKSIQTSWCGYTKTRPRREIRKGRLFHPEPQKKWLEKSFDEPCIIVNDENDLHIFFLWGGVALIERDIAAKHIPDLVEPREYMKDSSHLGFVGVSDLPRSKTQHAPSKKLRMSVIQRDEYRCRACGRSPADYVDVELHVHHIIPWGIGGITEEKNLITICKTCHDGLDPHYSPSLSILQKHCQDRVEDKDQDRREKHFQGILNYQLSLMSYLEENA